MTRTMNTDLLREPVLCAVSGGVDSMYLLCRLRELGYDVIAAHFDHGLRGAESERDARFVADFCAENDIRCVVESGNVAAYARENGLGIEEAARQMRYAFLEKAAAETAAGCIATAHNANDNAETMLFHLARGTGLRGLGGIPPVRGTIVRPMLSVTRAQAEAYLTERGIPHVEDSTNACDDYARNRIRHGVTPVLEQINAGFIENAARCAAQLRADEAFLSALAAEHIARHGADAAALAALAEPIAARVVMQLAGSALSASHIAAVLHTAAHGGAADIPGGRVRREGGVLVFGVGERENLPERAVEPGETALPEAHLTLRCTEKTPAAGVHRPFTTFFFSSDKICGKLYVTARRAGDRLRPAGRGCTKTLKQLFAENGVEAARRGAWPVIRDERGPLAVYGIGVDERALARPGEPDAIKIEFTRQSGEE